MPSIGFISHVMPVSVILQVIMPIIIGMDIIMGIPPIIGIMPFIIIGDIIGWPMPPIMGFIIGIMFIAVFIKVSRPAALFRVSMPWWVFNAQNKLKKINPSKNLSSNRTKDRLAQAQEPVHYCGITSVI